MKRVVFPLEPSRVSPEQESRVDGLALHHRAGRPLLVGQAFWVPSGSMLPTIRSDHLFVNKLAPQHPADRKVVRSGDTERNDIGVSSPRHSTTIKRLVAVAANHRDPQQETVRHGEHVEDGHANFVDPHVNHGPRDTYGPRRCRGQGVATATTRRQLRQPYWGLAEVDDIKGKRRVYFGDSETSGEPRPIPSLHPRDAGKLRNRGARGARMRSERLW